MTVMGTANELRTAVGSLGSIMEVWELMASEGEPDQDVAAVENNIRSTIKKGDEVRRKLLERGDITQEEASIVLSFVRMKRETISRLEEAR